MNGQKRNEVAFTLPMDTEKEHDGSAHRDDADSHHEACNNPQGESVKCVKLVELSVVNAAFENAVAEGLNEREHGDHLDNPISNRRTLYLGGSLLIGRLQTTFHRGKAVLVRCFQSKVNVGRELLWCDAFGSKFKNRLIP